MAKFWKLNTDEHTYFQTLVDFERAADPNYRAHLKTRISSLKQKHESIQERTQRTSLSPDVLQTNYFSSWVWSALHFLTSIPRYQMIEALSSRLGLRQDLLTHYLETLKAQGLVEKIDQRWKYKTGEFHAPKDSPLVLLHHQNWRSRAVLDAQDTQNSSVHFTGVYTLTQDDLERIKEMLLTFIAEVAQIAGPSNPEEAVVLTCDFFCP